jgi:SulP family sulfate permease
MRLPRLRQGRARVAGALRSVAPRRGDLRADALASIPGSIASVPDGMAASVLAGVSPIYGLYASMVGPIVGGLSAGTQLMVITTTGAAGLAAGSALQGVDPASRPAALFLLTVLAGAAMIAAGVLRLSRYTRFVSHSVMIGFLTGVAVNIILGQIPDLTGVDAEGPFALAKALDVVLHPRQINVAALLTGLAALGLLLVLARTRFALAGAVLALLVPTVAVALTGAQVERVADLGEIPPGLPLPALPDLSQLSFGLVAGALAVTAIVLVQAAGVRESAPNPDGGIPDGNRDFVAQGAANVAAGLFKGQPVGGSVGQTALNVTAGARSRWASVFRGVLMLVILVAFSGLVGKVALPTLAAVLIFAAVSSLRLHEMRTILRTGPTSQVVIVATFTATLLLPVATAVGIGVTLSLLLQLNQEAMDLAVVRLEPTADGRLRELPAPEHPGSNAVTLLDVYGSLLYAGSRTLQARLPDPAGTESAAVVLRLRGRTALGSTFYAVVTDYAHRLEEHGGRLFLSGVDPHLLKQAQRTRPVDSTRVFAATDVVGESSLAAYHAAQAWLAEKR